MAVNLKCHNCDFSFASLQCNLCSSSEALYCTECARYHLKQKPFKTHSFTSISSTNINGVIATNKISICQNCDVSESKHSCIDCSQHLCNGCSILHVKIKQYRTHRINSLNNNSNINNDHKSEENNLSLLIESINQFDWNSFSSILLDFIHDSIDSSYHILSQRRYDLLFWKTAFLLFIIVFLFCLISKLFFGSYSTVINGIGGLLFYYYSSNRVGNSGNNQATNNNTVQAIQNALDKTENFENEFWHVWDGKPTKFKPRTRPFKGRIRKQF
eukprot:gene11442-15329_t